MQFRESFIKGLFEITPKAFHDERGFFFESYNENTFKQNGLNMKFVQDNQSFSIPNVVRGLHFQKPPYEQGKLVRVIKGKILDVVVDIRKGSPTYGQHDKFVLDDERQNMVYVPEGFAHGFAALEESIVFYKCTNFYSKVSESGLLWNDKDLKIDWGIDNAIVSEKDQELSELKHLNLN